MFISTKYYDGTFDQEKFDKTLLASADQDGLMSKEDKAKLDELTEGTSDDNEVTTVDAADVVEDADHRFVTDDEKTTWNNQISRDVLGVANGVATLDEAGLVPASQLPGFVDDVVEGKLDEFPETGESDKLYVDTETNKTYRWSGSQYTAIVSDGLALGETSATAYAGDKGKAVAEIANAIMNGTSVVPKAQNAEMVNGHTVEVNVPTDAVFTDTVYEHPETHDADMINETEDRKFATISQLAKIDAIPEDPKYTDTVYEHPETHEAAVIVESDEKKFATKAQLDKLDAMPEFKHLPYYDEAETTLFACGMSVVISASSTTGNAVCTYVDNGSKSFEFPMGSEVRICGGGNGKNNTPFYPATCITVNSGTFKSVIGGNFGSGAIGSATIIVNGGTPAYIEAYHASDNKEYDGIVGTCNIVINDTEGAITCIYGGPQGLGTVGHTKLTMNGGTAQWVTAGGSNGYTGDAEVVINDGTITVLQGCNRGSMGNIKVTINGGTIQRVYAGGETEDSSVDASYIKAEMHVLGGTLGSVTAGTNGGVVSAVNVSGTYVEGVLTPEAAAAMNLTKAPMKFTDIVVEDGNLIFKNGDVAVKTLVL